MILSVNKIVHWKDMYFQKECTKCDRYFVTVPLLRKNRYVYGVKPESIYSETQKCIGLYRNKQRQDTHFSFHCAIYSIFVSVFSFQETKMKNFNIWMTKKVVRYEQEYMLQYFQLQDKFEQKHKSFTN
jgi:hypothetical protein